MCRRLLAFVATLCLCFSTFSVAYADGNSSIGDNWSSGAQVFWYPFDLGGSSKEYCMVSPCSNQFMAALCAIGQLDKYPQLTNPQLTLLSNDDTGGAFYDLAERFGSVAQYGYPSWIGGYYLWSISAWADFHTSAKFFGEDQVWYASGLNETMVTNAITDFFKVYNGEITGGLDGYNAVSGVSVPSLYGGSNVRVVDSNGLNPKVVTYDEFIRGFNKLLYIRNESQAYISSIASGTPLFFIANTNYSSGQVNGLYLQVYVPITAETTFTVDVASSGTSTLRFTGLCKYFSSFQSVSIRYKDDSYYLQCDVVFSSNNLYSTRGSTSDTFQWWYSTGGGGGGGGGGDNHWPEPTPPQPQPEPDPPEVPDPPDLPGPPQNPTIPEPDPPSPINPYTPIVEPEPTGTTPTDYTPWLRAILAALNRIIVDLATHCQHIQNAIRNASIYLVDAIGDYSEYLAGKLHYELTTIIADLESYLADLAHWLADELDFDRDAQVYDDARLLRILLDIYNRLGDLDSAVSDLSAQLGDIYIRLGQILSRIGSGGGGRPAPTTEPEVDEGFDFWQWLLELISSKLDAIIEDFVGDIGGFLSELVSKFPFSIPWDIAAYLTLLDAQRATPVISFVIPAIGGWWGEVPITVDLQPYDNAMVAVRSMMLILWGFCLIMRTDWLGGVFDGATKAVTSFFDRLTGHGGGD